MHQLLSRPLFRTVASQSQAALRVGASLSAHQTWRSCSSLVGSKSDDKASTEAEHSMPGAKTGGDKMAMLFTCTVCDTRSGKIMTKNAYENGVVIAICPGCENKHLIADNLGWFGDSRIDLETLMAAKGEQITRSEFTASGGTLELTEDDLSILSSGKPILRQKKQQDETHAEPAGPAQQQGEPDR